MKVQITEDFDGELDSHTLHCMCKSLKSIKQQIESGQDGTVRALDTLESRILKMYESGLPILRKELLEAIGATDD